MKEVKRFYTKEAEQVCESAEQVCETLEREISKFLMFFWTLIGLVIMTCTNIVLVTMILTDRV